MEVTLEIIYQQLQALDKKIDTEVKGLRAHIGTEVKNICDRIDSGKTWFVSLAISVILVVTAPITAFAGMSRL